MIIQDEIPSQGFSSGGGESIRSHKWIDNLQSNNYWSGTEYAPNTNNAWNFNFNNGNQNANNKNNNNYAWAVRSGKWFPMLFSFENIYRQYLLCRRNKRNTINALRFEIEQEKNLLELKEALETRKYQPSRSVCFFATKPKLREIFAADFRDRVVHHILVDYLEKIWEPIFIHDSYACRKGKGIHQGVSRLRKFIRKVTKNGTCPAWFMQLDVRNYFMSIDKDILYSFIAAKIKDEDALWLSRLLIYHDCTSNYHFRGDSSVLRKIPAHKSLFKSPENRGLPIGNLNSQFFANVYLNSLDQFVKHRLKCKYYLRYCDDSVLLSRDREELIMWRDQIKVFIRENLRLELKKCSNPQPVGNGINFLGYIVRGNYLLVRRRVVNNIHVKLREYESLLVKEGRFYRRYRFGDEMLDKLTATLSSYLGHFKMANTYNLCKSLWERYPFLSQYFELDIKSRKLKRKYKYPKGLKRVFRQYLYFRWRFKGDVILFQVGSFFEFYSRHDKKVGRLLGLSEIIDEKNRKKIKKSKRGVRYGFPVKRLHTYIQCLFRHKLSVSIILEKERYLSGIKERAPVYRFEYLPYNSLRFE